MNNSLTCGETVILVSPYHKTPTNKTFVTFNFFSKLPVKHTMDPLHQGHHHTNGQVLPHIVQVYESAADNDKLQDSQIIHITPALPSQGAHLTFQPLGHNLNVPVSGHNATLPQVSCNFYKLVLILYKFVFIQSSFSIIKIHKC